MCHLKKASLVCGTLAVLSLPQLSLATNGLNMIGYNPRSAGLGGADVALEKDCPACNPATLGGDAKHTMSGGSALLHPPVNFSNGLYGPNDADSDDKIYNAPYFEYAQRLDNTALTLGIAVRAQGGMGVDYDSVRTFAGTQDSLSTDLQFARIMPTAAYQVNDQLSIGTSLMIGYTRMNSELFPETYSPGRDGMPGTSDDFAGMELKDVSGLGYAGRIGLLYKVNERLSLGFTYLSETNIDMDDGELILNLGTSKVSYDASLDKFALPQEVEFGLSYKVTEKLRIVADMHWVDWSSTMDKMTIKGTAPNLPVPLQNPELTFNMEWDDQWVYAIGAEYALNTKHMLRVGYNYGKNPVPNNYLVPLFPGHVEHHLTLGYGYTMDNLRIDLAWEHSFTNKETNNNPNLSENPFGPDSEVTAEPGNVFHFGLTYWF